MYAKAQIDGVAHFDFRLLNKSDLEHRILAVIEGGGSPSYGVNTSRGYVADPDGYAIDI